MDKNEQTRTRGTASEGIERSFLEPYSGGNPVPSVQKYNEQEHKLKQESGTPQQKEKEDSRNAITGTTSAHKKHKSLASVFKRKSTKRQRKGSTATTTTADDDDRTPRSSSESYNDDLMVTDPITGKDLQRVNEKRDFEDAYTNKNVSVPQKQDDKLRKAVAGFLSVAPEATNVHFYPFPPVEFDLYRDFLAKEIAVAFIGMGVLELVRYISGLHNLTTSIAFVVLLFVYRHYISSVFESRWEDMKHEMEQARGEQAQAASVSETVEWLNSALRLFWPLADPELLTSTIDMVEDVMQASIPSIVHTVKIADVGQGQHPIRILSIKYLPPNKDEDCMDKEDEYLNLEIAFAYRRNPARTIKGKSHNMHLLIYFYVGLRNVAAVPIPVWVEAEGLVGRVRTRMQLTAGPPFIKHLTLSFPALPKFEISAAPLNSRLFNIMNFPLISTFIKQSIKAAGMAYVAPNSMTIDISKILVGDDVKKVPDTLGILWLVIHNAEELQGLDKGGKSDPYVCIAFQKFGKPIFSTRVITKELNPHWEETCAVLVTLDTLQAREKLSVHLYDSDRFTSDDVLGKIEIELQKLVSENAEHMQTRKDNLHSPGDNSPSGKLNWEIGFFTLQPLNKDLQTNGADPAITAGVRDNLKIAPKAGKADTETEAAALFIPPDPNLPSGILAIQVHQAIDLEIKDIRGTYGRRKDFARGQDIETKEVDERVNDEAPSAYCNIILNDCLIYRTRTKSYSTKPFFNAGTERFIADWRSSALMVTVMDSRTREADAILGIVFLKLADVMKSASCVSKFYPLAAGVGYGKIRLSLVFRSIALKMPRPLLGWNVGVLRILGSLRADDLADDLRGNAVHVRTLSGAIKLRANLISKSSENYVEWQPTKLPLRLPMRGKHSTPLIIEFRSKFSRKITAMSVYWLRDLIDHTEVDLRLPIWTASDYDRLTQNYIHPDVDTIDDAHRIGWLSFRVYIRSGLGTMHDNSVKNGNYFLICSSNR